jgi:hypothetical protein
MAFGAEHERTPASRTAVAFGLHFRLDLGQRDVAFEGTSNIPASSSFLADSTLPPGWMSVAASHVGRDGHRAKPTIAPRYALRFAGSRH